MQQDAHEFLNFLINHINEIIVGKFSTKSRSNTDKFNFFSFQLNATNSKVVKIQKIPALTQPIVENQLGSVTYFKAFLPAKRVV